MVRMVVAATVERLSDTDKRYKYMRTRRLVIIINLEQQLTRHGYDVKALRDQFDKPAEIASSCAAASTRNARPT